jgi:hypothetical protein
MREHTSKPNCTAAFEKGERYGEITTCHGSLPGFDLHLQSELLRLGSFGFVKKGALCHRSFLMNKASCGRSQIINERLNYSGLSNFWDPDLCFELEGLHKAGI